MLRAMGLIQARSLVVGMSVLSELSPVFLRDHINACTSYFHNLMKTETCYRIDA